MIVAAVAYTAGLSCTQTDPQITNLTRTASGDAGIAASAAPGANCTLQSTDDLQQAFTNIADSTRLAAGDGSVAWTVPIGAASPTYYRMRQSAGKTLITWSMLEAGLVGTFALPMAQEGDYRFGFSSGVHAQLTNGNLLVVGHPYHDRQAEVQLPFPLDGREGTRVGAWIDITKGMLPDGWGGGESCLHGHGAGVV